MDTMSSGKTYRAESLTQIAMPMGGIGAGCVCLTGIGGIQDFSIRNKPATTARQDGHGVEDAAFALLHIKGRKPTTLLVEGPLPAAWVYDRGLQAQGFRKGGHEGLPRFRHCTFTNEYPFGTVNLKDRDVPLTVQLAGWSPFIPLDEKNSGIPCAILDYTIRNSSKRAVNFEFSYHLSHLPAPGINQDGRASRSQRIDGGAMQYNRDNPASDTFASTSASASLSVIGHEAKVKASWFRGGWFDAITMIWRECSEGRFEVTGPTERDQDGRNGCSVLVAAKLKPGASITIPVLITWYFPHSNVTAGVPKPKESSLPIAGDCGPDCDPAWKTWYSTQWTDAGEVARHVRENYVALRRRTMEFKEAIFGSTLPAEAIDAIASNLAILKSPTVLRQANGNLWGWEGCFAEAGCCHGSCTHVWNYAQAIPNLFPALERTLRQSELERSMDERGHIHFRATLPDGPGDHGGHAAADGQLGGIIKVWREWQISGDRAWLEKIYPAVKRSLGYCMDTWDPDRRGLIVEPHHNTYDIEFWGPDGMCSSIYLGALTAMADMAMAMNEPDYAEQCRSLAERGAAAMDSQLFNGDYYIQQVQWENLRDQSLVQKIAEGDPNDPAIKILKAEGPKYQYGKGCLSDGVIGAWMSELYGLGTPLKAKHVARHLDSIFKYNFRENLERHANCQRPGYAVGEEAGLLLCTWPKSRALALPFPYADEVWTGIEYQVASHLILHGRVEEGLTIVCAARHRYDGQKRNPFNEYECGSYYARAMASYALLQSLTGFRYSAATRTLYLAPMTKAGKKFQTFFAAATGFGVISVAKDHVLINMLEGELVVDQLVLAGKKMAAQVMAAADAPAKIVLGATP
jgi:uncharacterized protein (DUF608 family)